MVMGKGDEVARMKGKEKDTQGKMFMDCTRHWLTQLCDVLSGNTLIDALSSPEPATTPLVEVALSLGKTTRFACWRRVFFEATAMTWSW